MLVLLLVVVVAIVDVDVLGRSEIFEPTLVLALIVALIVAFP